MTGLRKGTRRHGGFSRAATLLQARIRAAGEQRGFAVARLLTHWAEVAGADLAEHTRPVEVRYGRGGFGATLTLLTTGAQAPVVEMQKERLRARVNACYGYAAVSRIRITQTAPTGFAEPPSRFDPAPRPSAPVPTPEISATAATAVADIADTTLRDALSALGAKVLSRNHSR